MREDRHNSQHHFPNSTIPAEDQRIEYSKAKWYLEENWTEWNTCVCRLRSEQHVLYVRARPHNVCGWMQAIRGGSTLESPFSCERGTEQAETELAANLGLVAILNLEAD